MLNRDATTKLMIPGEKPSWQCTRPMCPHSKEGTTEQCATHNAEDRKAERNALKEPKKKQPIKRRSDKRAGEERAYNKRVKEWIKDKQCAIFPNLKATQCHHRAGRQNELLLIEDYWLPVSQEGHDYIHNNPAWSLENVHMLLRSVTQKHTI